MKIAPSISRSKLHEEISYDWSFLFSAFFFLLCFFSQYLINESKTREKKRRWRKKNFKQRKKKESSLWCCKRSVSLFLSLIEAKQAEKLLFLFFICAGTHESFYLRCPSLMSSFISLFWCSHRSNSSSSGEKCVMCLSELCARIRSSHAALEPKCLFFRLICICCRTRDGSFFAGCKRKKELENGRGNSSSFREHTIHTVLEFAKSNDDHTWERQRRDLREAKDQSWALMVE